ncbi:MAG: methyltransferase domain-containing protein [Chloroflexi bacterium]|nr:methyltransferase domain-containing protein [Chloroflexota bacterium]
MPGELDGSADLWERNARTDPLWAVLAAPDKKGRRWNATEFFKTGERDVAEILGYVDVRGARPRMGRALDFGCGVGRLTQALATCFERVEGVDVSPTMIELARQYDRTGRCTFSVNTAPDLKLFADGAFDFALSILVLQHIPSPFAIGYVRELCRVVGPGGTLFFQAPHQRHVPLRQRRATALRRLAAWMLRRESVELAMYALPQDEVREILRSSGLDLIEARPDVWAGDDWESFTYLARKLV